MIVYANEVIIGSKYCLAIHNVIVALCFFIEICVLLVFLLVFECVMSYLEEMVKVLCLCASFLAIGLGLLFCSPSAVRAAHPLEEIVVFVALCDNEHQGIAPVPAKIGKGDDPENNLYWGCTDGAAKVFSKSPYWGKALSKESEDENILRDMTYRHKVSGKKMCIRAYRGDKMQPCLEAFFLAVASGQHQLAVFIGHNGLMDGTAEMPSASALRSADAMVLCCRSHDFFADKLTGLGASPVLLTKQNMYPGAFILEACLEAWIAKKAPSEVLAAAAKSYAKNQKLAPRLLLVCFGCLKGED